MQRVMSGIQPTGEIHLGNYFGAVRNWIELQHKYECYFCVVDLHAMTMPYEPETLRANTRRLVVDLLACGIDPEKSALFIQSMVPEHSELNWYFNCFTSYGELSRMTQFKDKSAQVEEGPKGELISAGLFTYPILQAADILVYKAMHVPVGKDQEQHLELSRNIAIRFNNKCGVDFFPEPQPLFTEIPKLMSLADPTKKMSKSLGDKHYIKVFEPEDTLRKKIASAVTDSGEKREDGSMAPGVENLISLLRISGHPDAADGFINDYNAGTLRYKPLKDAVADALVTLTTGFIARREAVSQDESSIDKAIKLGAEKARATAAETMQEVRRLVGAGL